MDKFLIITAGEVIATRSKFKDALRHAKKYAADHEVYVTIDIVEQRLITGVYSNGRVIGWTEGREGE